MTNQTSEYHNGDLSNSAFLQHLLAAAPKGSSVWVNAFIGNPNGAEASWGGKAYNAAIMASEVDGWSRQNTYFSVGAVTYAKDGSLHRRKSHFARLLALVADDVDPDDLLATPSWGIQTSPGKRQIGILLNEQDIDCANLELVLRLVTVMAEKGHIKADLSGNNAVRYVRLPVGQNQKPRDSGPFAHVVEYWNPNIRYTLEDAAAAFGINLDEIRNQKLTVNERVTLHQGEQDERLQVLTANILRGENLHDSLNIMAASLVASGTKGGAVVNILRALMTASQAARDDRWKARYDDIPRSVSTAQEKFRIDIAKTASGPESYAEEEPFEIVNFNDLDTVDPPPVDQVWGDLVPAGLVTVLGAHGGVGKSWISLMLCVSVALGREFLGIPTKRGVAVFYSGEDDKHVARRRLKQICVQWGVRPSDLLDRLFILDASDADPTLYREGHNKNGTFTRTFDKLREFVVTVGASLIVVDNASDAYDANENDRARVRAFLRLLAKMARSSHAGMLLLAHVDKNTSRRIYAKNEEGYSGSTAWNNSARSRLFMHRDEGDSKSEVVIIEHQKVNHGRIHQPLRLYWPESDGLLPVLSGESNAGCPAKSLLDSTNTKALLQLIHEFDERGEFISASKNSPDFVSKKCLKEPSYPKKVPHKEVAHLIREAERAKYLETVTYRTLERKEKQKLVVTLKGMQFAGIAPSAPSAPSAPCSGLGALGAKPEVGAPTARTSAQGYGGRARAQLVDELPADHADELTA